MQDFGWGGGGFITKLWWTFPDLQQTATHLPMVDLGFELGGGAHSQIVGAQNALLGGSGGMPPQENLGLFLVQFQDKLAKHAALRVFLINLKRNFLTFLASGGECGRTSRTPPAYRPGNKNLLCYSLGVAKISIDLHT